MNFERGGDIRKTINVGEIAVAEHVSDLYLYGMVIMPSGNKPDLQIPVVQEKWVHRFLSIISRDEGLQRLDEAITHYIRTMYSRDEIRMSLLKKGEFRLCNPTIFTETREENEYRIPRTLRHYKGGEYLEHKGRKYKMPPDIDRYVRFAADDFDWNTVE